MSPQSGDSPAAPGGGARGRIGHIARVVRQCGVVLSAGEHVVTVAAVSSDRPIQR